MADKKVMTLKDKLVRRRNIARWGRVVVQMVFLVMAPALFSSAFGGLKEAFSVLGQGGVLEWTSFTIRLAFVCVVTIIFGRIFCGWACVFGAVGDWVYQVSQFIQKKTKKKLPQMDPKVIRACQKMKYVVLIGILALCFFGKSGLITKYSPWTVFSMITVGNFKIGVYPVAIFLMLVILFGMAFCERFFCQFLCPMGSVFSLLPEIPFLSLKRDGRNCIPNCQLCKKQCPVHIKLQEDPMKDGECIKCGRCATGCPRTNIKPGVVIHCNILRSKSLDKPLKSE